MRSNNSIYQMYLILLGKKKFYFTFHDFINMPDLDLVLIVLTNLAVRT